MVNSGKAAESAARGKRLSAALRENLKKRKAQARARASAPQQDAGTAAAPPKPEFRRNPGSH